MNSKPVSCAQFVALAGNDDFTEFHCKYGWNPPLEQRRQALDGLIDEDLLRGEAAARGFEGLDGGVSLLIDAEEQALRAQPVSDAEVTWWWERNHAWLDLPAKVRVEEIRVGLVSRGQAAAMQVAGLARAQIAGGEAFETVANRLSEDGWARWGGDLGWVARDDRRDGVEPEVIATAFGLVDGELSPPVIGERAVYLVRRKSSKSAQTFDLQAHRVGIEASVRQGRVAYAGESLLARLRGAATITVDEERLARVTLPGPSRSALIESWGDYAEDPCGRSQSPWQGPWGDGSWAGGETDPWPPDDDGVSSPAGQAIPLPKPRTELQGPVVAKLTEGDAGAVDAMFKRKSGTFQSCTAQALKVDPNLFIIAAAADSRSHAATTPVSGRIKVGWAVAAGRVQGAAVIENTTGDASLGSCFITGVRSVRFDDATSGTVEATWEVGLQPPR